MMSVCMVVVEDAIEDAVEDAVETGFGFVCVEVASEGCAFASAAYVLVSSA